MSLLTSLFFLFFYYCVSWAAEMQLCSGSFTQVCGACDLVSITWPPHRATEYYRRSLNFPHIYADWAYPLYLWAAETQCSRDCIDTVCLGSIQPPAVRAHCGSKGKGSWRWGTLNKNSPAHLHLIKRNNCFQC